MKLIKAEVRNFGSYGNTSIDFLTSGLCLVSGPTGSGKSTFCDFVPWICFGRTSKGGAVDEIRSWNSDETTYGSLTFDTHTIVRTRKPNDLTIDGRRGKDLADTQRIINDILGMDYELYLASAYMHEFSQTAQFFTTSPKNRRALSEQLVDLKLAKTLALASKDQEKDLNTEYAVQQKQLNQAKIQLDTLKSISDDAEVKASTWHLRRNKQVKDTIAAYNSLEASTIDQLKTLEITLKDLLAHDHSQPCPTCGNATKSIAEQNKIKQAQSNIDRLNQRLELEYASAMRQIRTLRRTINPYVDTADTAKINKLSDKVSLLNTQIHVIEDQIIRLSQLQDLIPQFRNVLITDTIAFLEAKTNNLISEHFDGEMSISLKVEADDKLEVEIKKNGNDCAYTQLSKGQRQILKLCFCTAVMACAQNHNGLSIDTLFYDESLDGMDDDTKAKAFTLLEKVATNYSNVFVVEHNEHLKTMFNCSIIVSLQENHSIICRS